MSKKLAEEILGTPDLAHEDVYVPEWKRTVRVRGMTGAEKDSWEAALFRVEGKKLVPVRSNTRAELLVRCLVNGDGGRIFADSDAKALGEKSGAAIDRLYEVAARLSGLTAEDEAQLEGN